VTQKIDCMFISSDREIFYVKVIISRQRYCTT